mgnify:CR=1 FL=1
MNGFRFRLGPVLRIRGLQEQQARARLARARHEEAEAQAHTRTRLRLLRRAAEAPRVGTSSPEWVDEQDRLRRLADAVVASRAAEVRAAELSSSSLAQWEDAATELAAMERLEERHRDAVQAEHRRLEQRDLDEIATGRAAARITAARAQEGPS